ncbi:MAG: two-component regulator propeller domain-containing protein [Psychroserpens sp.]|uniref:hybrid sensor histidine kinase/response regulator transcription factor n=1 Tax=Psychroserpens sp. TaxID=2020870 RepID=UPI003002DBC0
MSNVLLSQPLIENDSLRKFPEKQIAFSHLSIENGLSQNSVLSMVQDSIGYMWFVTQDGLNRYNGRSFKIYNKQFEDITRPTFSRLGRVYIDKKNKLWIITNSGRLELYEPETDSFYEVKRFKAVSTIFQDKYFNTFIGTYSKGLFKIDAVTKDTIQLFKPKDLNRITYDFHQLKDDLIIATSGDIIRLKKDNSYQSLIENDNNIHYSTIEQTQDSTLWIGSYGYGLFYKKLKNDTVTQFKKTSNIDIPSDLNIEDLLVDSKNRLWIASYGNGAYLLDFEQNKLTNFQENKTNPFAIHYNDMLSLYRDNTGIIWLGSDGAGASYYDEHLIKFNVLTNKQMPKNVNIDVVRSISTDNQGNIWIGTSGKGLAFINNKNNVYKTISSRNSGLASNRIISLSHSGDDLWIGHQGYGLDILEPSGEYKYFPTISDYTIWRIFSQTPARSWLCTENKGLVLFDKTEGIIEAYNTNNSALTTNNIKAITRENSEILWLGTENHGVFQFNQKTKRITKLDLVNGPLKSLLFKDHILWVGTYGKGLLKYNTITKTLTSYTIEQGLSNNVIYGILSDNEDNLWLSSNLGLSRFNTSNEDIPVIKNYNNYDGLQALEFNTGAYYKSKNGTLYFGGLDGINWFNPGQITFNTVKPKTIISKLEIFSVNEPLIQNESYKHNQNTFTFTFSSLHFSQPERNLFKYKLENHDDNWQESGNINTAHYTNLSPNDYKFKVISSNYDGLWNDKPEVYNFTILKPWYLTIWSKLIYGLLLISSILFIYKYLKWRWHMKMQLLFEHDETERLKNLNDFKTKLYTNISHEFRTPLTLISGPIEKQLSSTTLSKEDKEELTLVKRSANRLLNLVNQMLDLSKIESGNLKLKVSQGNLSVVLKQLASAFEYKAREKQIHFLYHITDLKSAWFDKDVIEKTVSNLLSNAIKYAPEKGNVTFEATHQDGQIIIAVINNGNILTNEDLPKLFQRFYQANKKTDGAGIGLSLVKELAILSHGNIVAHNMNEDDIQFTITLPIERSYYNQSEIVYNDQEIEPITKAIKETGFNPKEDQPPNKNKPLLLIVEDDSDIRQFIKSSFNSKYKIVEASNGKVGISKAISHIPDIVISDIMMPITDGIELCNTLKHDHRTSHIPIILLTAKVGEENEIIGLKTGADDYITKPFSTEKLKIRVEKLILLREQLQKHFGQTFQFESKEIEVSSVEHEFLQRLQDVLDVHITKPDFNAEAFSKKMLMNRMQLHRKLKALTNLTTTEFLRSYRLKLAIKLLGKSDFTISEIAYQVGFNTPSYFIKSFKDTYKYTPTEYISNSK